MDLCAIARAAAMRQLPPTPWGSAVPQRTGDISPRDFNISDPDPLDQVIYGLRAELRVMTSLVREQRPALARRASRIERRVYQPRMNETHSGSRIATDQVDAEATSVRRRQWSRRMCRISNEVLRVLTAVLFVSGTCHSQTGSLPAAIASDPVSDAANPPYMAQLAVLSSGYLMNGRMYGAGGQNNHPTAVLLHGFPGYEPNLDLAQSMRRCGWNVVIFHYRGSWEVAGVSRSLTPWKTRAQSFASFAAPKL